MWPRRTPCHVSTTSQQLPATPDNVLHTTYRPTPAFSFPSVFCVILRFVNSYYRRLPVWSSGISLIHILLQLLLHFLSYMSLVIVSSNLLQLLLNFLLRATTVLLVSSYHVWQRLTTSCYILSALPTYYRLPPRLRISCHVLSFPNTYVTLFVTSCFSQLLTTSCHLVPHFTTAHHVPLFTSSHISPLLPISHYIQLRQATSCYFVQRPTTSYHLKSLLTTSHHDLQLLTARYILVPLITSFTNYHHCLSRLTNSYHILPPPVTTDVVSPSRATSHYLSLPLTTSPYSSPSLTSSCHMSPHWPKLTKTHHLLPCVTTYDRLPCNIFISRHVRPLTNLYNNVPLLEPSHHLHPTLTSNYHIMSRLTACWPRLTTSYHISPFRITSDHVFLSTFYHFQWPAQR